MDESEAVENDDCRINCTNSQSLRNILDITVNQFSELVDSTGIKNEKSEFVSRFTEVFKNTLQENVVVNGLPWIMDKTKLTSPEKEDHKQMIDDTMLSQLSKTVSNVASKRKYCPAQCCRILNMKMKHELQNLKKTKVISESSALPPTKQSSTDRKHIKKFSEFCKTFASFEENVQNEIKEKEKIIEKINIASQIQTRQRTLLKSLATDETVALGKI